MGAVGDLYALAGELLAAAAEAVALGPGGPIDYQYVSAGIPAWNCCPQLTVHAGGPAEASTQPLAPPLAVGHQAATAGNVHLVSLTVTPLRCAPAFADQAGDVIYPPVALLNATAEETMGDVWAVWNHVRSRYKAGTLFQATGCARELLFDPAVPVPTQGGCAGWQIPFRVQLDGFRTVT